jgi:hypothetical protein
MNRHRAWAALIMSFGMLTGVAKAQTAAPVTPSQNAYQNPGASKAEIDAFVKANVENLANENDPVAQGRSRENLSQATITQGAPASPEFLFEYGRSLNAGLVAKLDPKKQPGLRTRLNIAIVAARVAYVAQNITLQEVAIKLINDPAEPVVLWGIKTAQPMVPQAVKLKMGSAKPPLIEAILPAVFKHPLGSVFYEAYVALGGTNDPIVVGELMKLWENRLEQYRKGIPEDPAVDAKPIFMLTTKETWNSVFKDPKAQTDLMQMVTDQMYMAAQYADSTSGEQRDQLVAVVQQCAGACSVIGTNIGKPSLTAAASQAASIRPEVFSKEAKVLPMVSPGLIDEIRKVFPGVKAPSPVNIAGSAAPLSPQ